jgi:Secretion system C-terminal sorting domain/SprB repeat
LIFYKTIYTFDPQKQFFMKKIFLFIFILFSINIYSQMNLTVSPSPSCTGGFGSATIVINGGNGPYNYVLSKNNVVYLSGSIPTTVYTFANLSPTVYTIVVTDANTTTVSINFTIAPQLIPTWTWINTSCYGSNDGTLFINATGGTPPYTYSLSNGISPSSNNLFSNLASGTYELKVTDSYGCVFQSTVTIASPDRLISLINVTGQTITINTTGGVTPYLYSIDGISYQTGNVFSNLPVGNYNVSVRDTNGCFTSNVVTIVNSPPISVTASIVLPPCYGNVGSVNVLASGGQAPYTYSINNSPFQANTFFTNLVAGVYNFIVRDALGNQLPYTVIISQPEPLVATTTISNNNNIIVNALGGSPLYNYSINNGAYQSSNVFTNLPIGNYRITVLDANGCNVTLNSVVNVAAPIINGNSNPVTLTLGTGSTLANVVVQGNNITWYSTSGTLRNVSNKTVTETPLPLNTILVNGTTYYASQTINGFESQQRLAVTITLAPLSAQDFVFNNFKYYPNPVQDSFSLSNTTVIDDVSVSNILGKIVLTKTINNTNAALDLSGLTKGIYFVKVKGDSQEKVIKIVKE